MIKRGVVIISILILVFSVYVNGDITDGTIFVTGINYDGGNFGGLSGAHEFCRTEAEDAGFEVGTDIDIFIERRKTKKRRRKK